jgi:membrane protein implicated in regulation of membrane protease activity
METFNGLEIFYLICAIVGSVFVILKLILQFVGADVDGDFEADFDADTGIDLEHTDSDIGFHWLSMHGLSSFFMMFGFVGLALYRQNSLGIIISIVGGIIAGSISVWIISKIFQMASKLQSSGNLKTADSVGCKGKVYLHIPKDGIGRVTLNFKNRLREFDASEVNGEEVPTGTPVSVVKTNGNILIVETIK